VLVQKRHKRSSIKNFFHSLSIKKVAIIKGVKQTGVVIFTTAVAVFFPPC
jgi:hypothetical protein